MISFVVFGFLLASVYGGSPVNPIDKIIGGFNANIKDYPHQVSLQANHINFCSGSIISQRWILTSASCFSGRDLNGIWAVVGTNKLDSGGTPYKVGIIIRHESFNPNNFVNDIAVAQVTKQIIFSNKVKVINLAYNAPPYNTPCAFSGWGATSYPNQVYPNLLQHFQVNTISLQVCASKVYPYPIYTSQICTFATMGQGVCLGDGGGALVSNNVQIGILSWGIYCARGYPDVFTSVPAYRQWIQFKTGV